MIIKKNHIYVLSNNEYQLNRCFLPVTFAGDIILVIDVFPNIIHFFRLEDVSSCLPLVMSKHPQLRQPWSAFPLLVRPLSEANPTSLKQLKNKTLIPILERSDDL